MVKIRRKVVSALTLLSCVVLLYGCTVPPKPEAVQAGENALVPVNLLLNSGQIQNYYSAEQLMYLQKQIKNSGLFAGVRYGMSPWPYTVSMDATIDCSYDAEHFVVGLAAAATLELIPHTETCAYKIKADFFDGRRLLATRQYSTPYTKVLDLLGGTEITGNEKGLSKVYAKMVKDCLKNPPLPRAKSLGAPPVSSGTTL